MARTAVYLAGYPKSGTTWMTRLLADALNCPTGASTPETDHKEWVKEGQDRPAPFVVRRGHFVLVDDGECVVPRPHRINRHLVADERIVFLVRDPRDIAVSDSYHRGHSIDESLGQMTGTRDGAWSEYGSWDRYIRSWRDAPFNFALVRYEDLLADAAGEVRRIFTELALPFDGVRVEEAAARQSFAAKKAYVEMHGDAMPRGRVFQLKFVRKGIAGDWKNHFNRAQGKLAARHFNEVMLEEGYVESPDWWKELPE